MKPFVKWAGGKGKLLERLKPFFPSSFTRYVDPFIGGGAPFLFLRPQTATLSDINADLIQTYRAVRDDVETIISELHRLAAGHSEDQFYRVRDRFNEGERSAASFIYLNRTGFNGLWRVNRDGRLNAPFGHRGFDVPAVELRALSAGIQNYSFSVRDYADVLSRPYNSETFVYLDPPYHETYGAYTALSFGEADQELLKVLVDDSRAKVLISNADTAFIRNLYKDYRIDVIAAPRVIAANGQSRGSVGELVIRNW